MAQIIDIDLYRSADDMASPLRATSLRKPYTSLLFVLLFIAVGTGMYFVLSSSRYSETDAVVEKPIQKTHKPPLSVIVRRNLNRWANFSKNAMALNPINITSDGEEGFLCSFSSSSFEEAWAIRDSIKKFGKAPMIIDTITVSDTFRFVIRGKLKPSHQFNQGLSVEKYLRTSTMNFIDSIAIAKGMTKPDRIAIGIEKVKGGERYKYKFSSNGTTTQIRKFFNDIVRTKYCVSPLALSISQNDSLHSLQIVWALYTFSSSSESTRVAEQ